MLDPNATGINVPLDFEAIAADLYGWDNLPISPEQFVDLIDLIMDSPTMDMFENNWQEIPHYDEQGNLDSIEDFNPTSMDLIIASTEFLIGTGYYDGFAGDGGMFGGDGFDYVFSDWAQGVGSTYCPVDYGWRFYF